MVYFVALVVYVLDQVVKYLVKTHMHLGQSHDILSHYVVLDYIRNPGGAFGILPNFRWLFILVAVLVAAVIVFVDRKYRPTLWTKFALAFLLAGAFGNLTDRVLTGTVVDYVYLQFINFPVFNIADMAVDAGVIMLLIQSFRRDKATRIDHSREAKREEAE